jgi:hypothetical protein
VFGFGTFACLNYSGETPVEQKSEVLDFLTKTREDSQLTKALLEIISKHGNAQQSEIIALAHKHGYTFTDSQFRDVMLKEAGDKFAARRLHIPIVNPPESSCAFGCISWTRNWHPPDE